MQLSLFPPTRLSQHLTLEEFCTCTQTYQRYSTQIDPFPRNPESIEAVRALCQFILDPLIDYFKADCFQLTYGFCSPDLKRYLDKKDPVTGLKNGRINPSTDQHMAHETKNNGEYYCKRLGAASDFRITGVPSDQLVVWILAQRLPFDSLYFYGASRPIHISYGPEHKRAMWGFDTKGIPTKLII